MRWAEIGLFLMPFVLFAAWRLAAITARPSVLWLAVVAVVLFAAGTLWLGLSRRLAPGERYVPAQMQGGRIVPGHGATQAVP
jgi:hypothetical protein